MTDTDTVRIGRHQFSILELLYKQKKGISLTSRQIIDLLNFLPSYSTIRESLLGLVKKNLIKKHKLNSVRPIYHISGKGKVIYAERQYKLIAPKE